MSLKNEVENSWEWLRRRDLEGLEKKLLVCYGRLLVLEKKEWKDLCFNNGFGMLLCCKEEMEKLVEERWYEKNEYYGLEMEMKDVNEFIKKELLGKSERREKRYKN
uniref:hypothetical protein n=1 Tax=Bacillus thuringiensis TaxID=1428 RepID=UPI00164357B0